MRIAEGSVFASRFRIEEAIKVSPDSAVYKATDVKSGEVLCLKLLAPELTREPTLRDRFVATMKKTASLVHPHLVPIRDVGVEGGSGLPWIAMDFVDAVGLEQVLKEGLPPLPQARQILCQIGAALALAHKQGIAHGNLKPQNILLSKGAPSLSGYLLNLGIAKVSADAKPKLAALATPTWMAPEQAHPGQPPLATMDVWALGLLAFRLFTGLHFFREANQERPSTMGIVREVTLDPLPGACERATQLGVLERLSFVQPANMDQWFALCLTRNPEDRYPDAQAAMADLEALFLGNPLLGRVAPSLSEVKTLAIAPTPGPPQLPPKAKKRPTIRYLAAPLTLGFLSLGLFLSPPSPKRSLPKTPSKLPSPNAPTSSTPTLAATPTPDPAPKIPSALPKREPKPRIGQAPPLRTRPPLGSDSDCGNPASCLLLGQMLLEGRDFPRDPRAAAAALANACRQGNAEGCHLLGEMIQRGDDGPRNGKRAEEFFRKACSFGHRASCERLDKGAPPLTEIEGIQGIPI